MQSDAVNMTTPSICGGASAKERAPIEVRSIGDADSPAWEAFVAATPAAGAYHRYAWRGFLEAVFGLETHYLTAYRGDDVCGVLPLARQKSVFFGDYLSSLPYFNYGGICADGAAGRDALVAAAEDLGRGLGVQHVELRHSHDPGLSLPCRTDKVAMLLELPASADELLSGLKAKVRAQIRRPEREGIVCRQGGIELVREFHHVFARNMRDLGTPVYPVRFFETLMARFAADARIFVAELEERPVAAGVVLGSGDTLEIPWASSLREANRLGVNMYLYWQVLRWAIESGYRTFDFGRCSPDGGTYRFKKQWGAQPVQLHWHYLLYGRDELPRLNHSNPKYELLVRLWRKQPLALANAVSPLLAKHLP